jgi:hypothetical protein
MFTVLFSNRTGFTAALESIADLRGQDRPGPGCFFLSV